MAKIVILVPGHWLTGKGGSEYQADLLASYLTESTEHEVVYIARNISNIAGNLNYQICSVPPTFSEIWCGLFWDSRRLYRILEEVRPDAIVQRVASAYTGVAAQYSNRNHIPLFWCIASDRDIDPRTSLNGRAPGRAIDRLAFKFGLRNSSHIVAQTNDQSLALQNQYNRLPTAVIPNCHPDALGSLEKDSVFTVLWVANFKELKQPEVFIHLARSFADNPTIKFKMIGREEDSPWGAAILESIAKTPNIEYLGELDNDQVNGELSKSRLLINTSLYEGLSNTFIQAWKRHVPVLSLNVDPDSCLSEKGFGMISGTPQKLYKDLEYFMKNPKALDRMAVSAKKYADVQFSMQNAERLTNLIEAAISEKTA